MDTIEEDISDLEYALKFLKQFGYVAELGKNDSSVELSAQTKNAISKFQANFGLEVNGLLDEATIAEMKKPRCAVTDGQKSEEETLNYTLVSKWDKNELTWKITKYPENNLSESKCRETITQAMQMWQDVADLKLVEADTADCDLEIHRESGDHGEGDPFDQGGGTLAHAFLPSHPGKSH